MTAGTARRRPVAIVAMALMLAAGIIAAGMSILPVWQRDRTADPASAGPAIRIVDARTGQPIGDTHPAIPTDPMPVAKDDSAASRVRTLAARGAGDMPMLAEMVATQPRAPGDAAAEARAAQLLSRHLRLAAGHPLRVRCAAALCQVTGTITSPATAIEAPALLDSVLAAGWTPGPVASAPAPNGATDVLLFLNRES